MALFTLKEMWEKIKEAKIEQVRVIFLELNSCIFIFVLSVYPPSFYSAVDVLHL